MNESRAPSVRSSFFAHTMVMMRNAGCWFVLCAIGCGAAEPLAIDVDEILASDPAKWIAIGISQPAGDGVVIAERETESPDLPGLFAANPEGSDRVVSAPVTSGTHGVLLEPESGRYWALVSTSTSAVLYEFEPELEAWSRKAASIPFGTRRARVDRTRRTLWLLGAYGLAELHYDDVPTGQLTSLSFPTDAILPELGASFVEFKDLEVVEASGEILVRTSANDVLRYFEGAWSAVQPGLGAHFVLGGGIARVSAARVAFSAVDAQRRLAGVAYYEAGGDRPPTELSNQPVYGLSFSEQHGLIARLSDRSIWIQPQPDAAWEQVAPDVGYGLEEAVGVHGGLHVRTTEGLGNSVLLKVVFGAEPCEPEASPGSRAQLPGTRSALPRG